MSSARSTTRWTGVLPAITTKFHADERIDAEGAMRHIDFQIRNGIHDLVTCGSPERLANMGVPEAEIPDSVRAIYAANFAERKDIPAWHPDVRTPGGGQPPDLGP